MIYLVRKHSSIQFNSLQYQMLWMNARITGMEKVMDCMAQLYKMEGKNMCMEKV